MSSRILILDVDADKYDGIVEALRKKPSVRVVSMDREARRHLRECPACCRKLSKESAFTIDEKIIDALIKVTQRMRVAKTVVLVNEDNPQSALSSMEHERCVEVDAVVAQRAVTLGLLKPFMDGARLTHYVSASGLEFLSGNKPASPCTMHVLDGEVVETSGEMMIENVKFKDVHRATSVARDGARAVKAIPQHVTNFVINGQMSLI
jgi:hypothetical protein